MSTLIHTHLVAEIVSLYHPEFVHFIVTNRELEPGENKQSNELNIKNNTKACTYDSSRAEFQIMITTTKIKTIVNP